MSFYSNQIAENAVLALAKADPDNISGVDYELQDHGEQLSMRVDFASSLAESQWTSVIDKMTKNLLEVLPGTVPINNLWIVGIYSNGGMVETIGPILVDDHSEFD